MEEIFREVVRLGSVAEVHEHQATLKATHGLMRTQIIINEATKEMRSEADPNPRL